VAIGVWIASYSAGAAIGPVVGGVLLQYFWWGSVFLVSVPVMVLLLLLGPILLPEYRDPAAGRLDFMSAALSLAAVLATIYGVKRVAESGLAWLPMLSIAAGLIVGVVFMRRQTKLADPMIDLRLFRAPAFSAALAIYALATFVAFGTFLFVAQYLQLVLGLGPLQAGLWSMPFAFAFIVGSMLTPQLARHFKPGYLMAAGLVVAAAGFALLARVDGSSGIMPVVVAFVVYSLGLAPVFTLATDLIVGAAPPERAGAASALSETASEFGGALGIAILGSIGAVIYRGALAQTAPSDVTPEVLETARTTLGAAVAASQLLGEAVGVALAGAARAAFIEGLQVSAGLAAFAAAATAIVAALVLGRLTHA
jgi:DHA2 family multidrug resistance protein-like MFS transporter